MSFDVNKCHFIQVGTRNQKLDYEMKGVKTENVQCVKDIGVTIASNLRFSRHYKDAANKDNRILAFINRNFFFMNKAVIMPLYVNLVTPHLKHGVQFSSSRHTKDLVKFKAVQRRATKMIPPPNKLC